MNDQTDSWLRTDEIDDVAGSLRHAVKCREWVVQDPQAWKWFTLAIHNALQGACVCHLATTAQPVGVVSDKDAAKWIEFIQRRPTNAALQAPRTRLLALPELLAKARQPKTAGDASNEAGITLSDSETSWLERIHSDVRNQFTHFDPMCWSLEISGLPAVGALIARIIGEIADMRWAFRQKDEAWLLALRDDLNRLSAI